MKSKLIKHYKIIIGLSVILVLFCIFILTSNIIDPDNELNGNNAIASYYEMSIGNTCYSNIFEALKSKDKNVDNEVNILSISEGNVSIVFQKGTDDFNGIKREYVIGYEFIQKQGYYYSGDKKIYIDALKEDLNCTWEDTVKADISQVTKKSYRKICKRYNILPAWGISDNHNVENMLIDGQAIDQTIPISIDGTNYYLWIIKDLHTNKSAKDISIDMCP